MNELLQGWSEFEVDAGYDQVVVIHDFFWIWVYLGQKGCEAECMRTLRNEMSEYAVIIVTGGSSGIGKAFIEHAWRLNPEVVICNLSRREPAIILNQLKLRHVAVDLSDSGALQRACDEVLNYLNHGAPAGRILLVNNSGFGGYGKSDELDRGHQLEMIDLNVRAVVDLTNRLLPVLRQRGGAIINIASTAAFQPTAYLATYGATKAFLLHWSLALNEELRGSGVRALAVCPGPTATEFFKRAGLKQGAVSDRFGQTCDEVIETTLRALAGGRAQVVSGWGNWLVAAFSSRLPKPWAARLGAAVLAKFRMSRVASVAAGDGGAK
jgi:short-subunit dehydrogenase